MILGLIRKFKSPTGKICICETGQRKLSQYIFFLWGPTKETKQLLFLAPWTNTSYKNGVLVCKACIIISRTNRVSYISLLFLTPWGALMDLSSNWEAANGPLLGLGGSHGPLLELGGSHGPLLELESCQWTSPRTEGLSWTSRGAGGLS